MSDKPNLSVGRGEKLSVSKGGGLTAKGRAKYKNQDHGLNHFVQEVSHGRVIEVRLLVRDGDVVKELVVSHPQRGSYPSVLVLPKVQRKS